MIRVAVGAAAGALLSVAPAAASDLSGGGPAELLEAAAGTCLVNVYSPTTAVAAFRDSGWEVGELDGGAWEMTAPGGGVFAFVNADRYCRVEVEGVGLEEARQTARMLLNVNFPDQFRDAGSGPCAGFELTTVDGIFEVSLDGLGQDPICPDPNGAAIVIEAAE